MKDYLMMADVFVGEYKPKRRIDAWPPSRYGETLIELSGSPAQYAAHAINSHDELVAMNKELLGIINRIIDTSTELEGKAVSSPWSEGYKQCSIDTGKAIIEMLGRIEGGEK